MNENDIKTCDRHCIFRAAGSTFAVSALSVDSGTAGVTLGLGLRRLLQGALLFGAAVCATPVLPTGCAPVQTHKPTDILFPNPSIRRSL